jgi:cell division protein FtsB
MRHVPAGTAGGEAQQADVRQLLKELEIKKAKLNELKGDSRKTEAAISKIRDDDTDAQRLTPDDCVEENAYIQVCASCL